MAILESDGEISFSKIRSKILEDSDIQDFIANFVDNFESQDLHIEDFVNENSNRILQLDTKELGSILSTTKTALDIFSDPIIKKKQAVVTLAYKS